MGIIQDIKIRKIVHNVLRNKKTAEAKMFGKSYKRWKMIKNACEKVNRGQH